jgi:FAD synthase
VFIVNQFEGEFYGEHLEIKINSFIRAEGSYSEFSDLIDVMQMDIQVCSR